MTAKLPILPGEDEAELHRRLEVWPRILGAETEIERLEAIQAVHMAWRRARSLRSDDAAAERRMIAIKKDHTDRQAQEAQRLGAELDSDVDPKGVVRKLQSTPAGCMLLLSELRGFSDCLNKYGVLFWAQRERFFHCVGRRLRDLFTGDRVITDWVVALMGAAYGDEAPAEKFQEISAVLEGLRPAWMDPVEYQIRMNHLVAQVAAREASLERVKSYLASAIDDLKKRLKRAQARSRRELKLELQSAWVDDTVAGARRLRYQIGHDRSYEASLKRIEKSKKARREEGSPTDDSEDRIDPGSGGVGDWDLGVGESSDPGARPAVPRDASPALVGNENEPIWRTVGAGDDAGSGDTESYVTVESSVSSALPTANDRVPPAVEDQRESDTNEPISRLTIEPSAPSIEPGAGPPVPNDASPALVADENDPPRQTPPRRGEQALGARSASEGYVDSGGAMASALAGASGSYSPDLAAPGTVAEEGRVWPAVFGEQCHENEPIWRAVGDGDEASARDAESDVTVKSSVISVSLTANYPVLPAVEDPRESDTNEPISRPTIEPLPPSIEPQPAPPVQPPEGEEGPQRAGEPPPERPPA
jgi:hypothetical protein